MTNKNTFMSCIILLLVMLSTRAKAQSSPPPNFISKDSANKMIRSYLVSINDSMNTQDLRSLVLDAESMRKYLADTTIKHVKFMLAHTLQYINSGNAGKPAGYTADELTIIMAGYDASGNYVYYDTEFILNRARPCPPLCPPTGTAAQPTLP